MSNPSQPKFKKASDDPLKYFPPKPKGPDGRDIQWEESPRTAAWILEYANNCYQREQDAKDYAKQQEEEQRKMAEREKREEELRKQREEHNKNLPENQLRMLLSGAHYECHIHHLPMDSGFLSY
jgi:hypothetical protein